MNKSKKEFKILIAKDIRELLKRKEYDEKDFKIKPINKKNPDILMLSRKGFKHYTELSSAQIVGNVRYRQRNYKNYTPQNKLEEEKQKHSIIGQFQLPLENDVKLYDIKKSKKRHTVGYAWVGGQNFIRVTTFNPIILFIPLLLLLLLLLPKNDIPSVAPQKPIDKEYPAATAQPENINVDYCPFPETVTLSANSNNLSLKNLISNKNIYDISYEIFIDGKSIGSTGAIEAGYEVPLYEGKFNLYETLEPGTYELSCLATEYDFITKKPLPQTYLLTTTLVVEK